MARERQVNKFNRLTNRFNNRDRDSSNISTHTTSNGNQVQDTYSNNNGNIQLQSSNSSNNTNKWVVNLSKTTLTQAQMSFLSKGPNFAVTPNNPPNVDHYNRIGVPQTFRTGLAGTLGRNQLSTKKG